MPAPTSSAAPAEAGLGTRCPESQADGVPCAELGTDCEICGRAYPCFHETEPDGGATTEPGKP